VLLVAKPAGPTSHDIVDVVRRALDTTRVGHLGTLDPFAEGLLVLVVGRATRLAQFAHRWRKTYDATMRLGVTTTTDDRTGEREAESDAWRSLDRAAVEDVLSRFRGTVTQRPPVHSAVNVAGERAYKRARRGETVVMPERQVAVEQLELLEFAPPVVRFRATVGGGTYIRSLARDMGTELGCGAHLDALVRTAVGPFQLAQAKAPAAVSAADLQDAALLVADLPQRALEPGERDAAVHGRPLPAEGEPEAEHVALFAGGQLVGVAERVGDLLKPRVVVAE
jgi:tRNA pseudouridine55 synthase